MTYENNQVNWAYQEEPNRYICLSMRVVAAIYAVFQGYDLCTRSALEWHHYYDKRRLSVHIIVEDLPVTGTFECRIAKGEELYMSVSDERCAVRTGSRNLVL